MPHEENRKILKIGNSLCVTLPADWVRYFKLSAKDEVRMISNSNITIEPPHKQTDKAQGVKSPDG